MGNKREETKSFHLLFGRREECTLSRGQEERSMNPRGEEGLTGKDSFLKKTSRRKKEKSRG